MNSDEIIERHRAGGEYVSVDGLKIFYRKAGQGGGVPIVLTHGIPRSSFLYRRMIPLLAKQRPVRAWDLYGFGLSEKPTESRRYHFREFERVFGLFLDALNIERAHLVCHDVGGPFTIGYAMRNQSRVASLTILNTTVFVEDFRIPGPVLASILLPLSLHRAVMPDAQYADFLVRYIQKKAIKNPQSLSGEEAEAYKKLLLRDNGRLTFVRAIKAYRSIALYLRGIHKLLGSFRPPTFVLWGKHDPFCTLPTARAFRRAIPNAELDVIENAGHFLQEDAPEETAAMILDFIGRLG